MTYDDWKLETPEDEAYRKMGKIRCEDCDERRATNACEANHRGPYHHTYWLCEPCAERRECKCGGFGTEWSEDLTGYDRHGGQWLCVECAEREPDDPPDAPIINPKRWS
jgi:hypothetical protein